MRHRLSQSGALGDYYFKASLYILPNCYLEIFPNISCHWHCTGADLTSLNGVGAGGTGRERFDPPKSPVTVETK